MQNYLPLLLSYYLALQYKLHAIHTDAKWPWFLYIHPFLDEVYQFFGDDSIDWIKERCNILWLSTASNLETALWIQNSIKQLDKVPTIQEAIKIVYADLVYMEGILQTWIDVSGKVNDLVTQNKLIDYLDILWKLRRKLQFELWL